MEKLNLVFYQFDREVPMIEGICKDLDKKDDFEMHFVKSYTEVQKLASQFESMVFVFRLAENQDLAQAVGILQSKKLASKDGLFKSLCIQGKPAQRKVERLLRNLGCNEFFDTSSNIRTVRFKIDFLGRGVQAAIKKKELQGKVNNRSNSQNSQNQKEEDKIKTIPLSPLKIESDIWILKTEEDFKKVLGRWLFRMIGPSTRVGSWQYFESNDKELDGLWQYCVDPEFIGKFIVDEGTWYFRGSKPDFDWKSNRWNFSSPNPSLFFKDGEGNIHSRFRLEEKELFIAKNSQQALLKEKEILETCDGRFSINSNNEGSGGNESSVVGSGNNQKPDRMEGKGFKDQQSARLQGKNSSEKDAGPLDGKTKGDNENIDGHLKGGLKKTGAEEDGSLNGKTKGENENVDGNLKGDIKNPSAEKDGPLDGKTKGDNENVGGNLKGDIKNPGAEEDGPQSGKTKGDNGKVDGHLKGGVKGKNTAESGDLKGDIKKPSAEKEGPLDGKTKGDKKNIDGHLKGGVKEKITAEAGDLKGDVKKTNAEENGPLAGKTKGDKKNIDGHLKGKAEQKEKAKEAADNVHAFKKEQISPKLKGKITPEKESPVSLESGSLDAGITVNGVKISADFEDMLEEELYIRVKKESVKVNEPVQFSVSFSYGEEQINLKGTGVTGEVENDDDFDMVIVDIKEVNSDDFKRFLELYEQRQESISTFLSLAKGA